MKSVGGGHACALETPDARARGPVVNLPGPGVPEIVLRAPRPRVVQSALYFGLGAVVLAIGAVTYTRDVRLASCEVAVAAALAAFGVRAERAGFLCVSPTHVVARTTARTRTISVTAIESVEAVESWKLVYRVLPTITLRDGSTHQLGDFAMRSGPYHRARAEGRRTRTDSVVTLIRSVL
jgi:hypothetical protein